MPREYDVLIVGAGFAGLAAGKKLVEQGYRVLVIENEPGLTHQSYYPGIDSIRVKITKKYMEIIDSLNLRRLGSDKDGAWFNPLEILVMLASEFIRLGGYIIVDSSLEPIYRIYEDRIFIVGANIRYYEEGGGPDRFYVKAKTIIDASPSAALVNNLLDRLKLGIIVQGAGPQIPGSDDVVDKTTWIFPGVIVAGLSAIIVNGAYIPFPDIGPLLGSGARAADLAIKGYPENPNEGLEYPSII